MKVGRTFLSARLAILLRKARGLRIVRANRIAKDHFVRSIEVAGDSSTTLRMTWGSIVRSKQWRARTCLLNGRG